MARFSATSYTARRPYSPGYFTFVAVGAALLAAGPTYLQRIDARVGASLDNMYEKMQAMNLRIGKPSIANLLSNNTISHKNDRAIHGRCSSALIPSGQMPPRVTDVTVKGAIGAKSGSGKSAYRNRCQCRIDERMPGS